VCSSCANGSDANQVKEETPMPETKKKKKFPVTKVRMMARLNLAARKSFKQLARIDSKCENDFTEQMKLSQQLIANLGIEGAKIDQKELEQTSDMDMGCQVYKDRGSGFSLNFPITFAEAERLREHYCQAGVSKPLGGRVTAELVKQFTEKYYKRYNTAVADVSVPTAPDSKLVVAGDTHGQLQDVLFMFHEYGPPSASNVYLFNGDIADRGPNSVEIFLLLFAYFLADPSCILINRGNHESEDMNALTADDGGGFRDEVIQKYDPWMYQQFVSMMMVLSICTVIQKQVFVVHAGLSRDDPTLDFIRGINHTSATVPSLQATDMKSVAWVDFLWSDPVEERGMKPSDRGAGCLFGPDVTERFMKNNPPISLIVRGHQLPEEDEEAGHMMHHNKRVITIFSASNYCGDSGNRGAVIIFRAANFPEYTIKEFYSPELEQLAELSTKAVKDWAKQGQQLRERTKNLIQQQWKQKELQKIISCIVEKKPDILELFLKEAGDDHLVDFKTWERVLSQVIGGRWRWDVAWESWKLPDANGMTNTVKFLKRFGVILSKSEFMAFKYKTIMTVFERILNAHHSVSQTRKLFDHDGDGAVDIKELRVALTKFDLGLEPSQLDSLTFAFFNGAAQKGGVPTLTVNEFLGKFTNMYKRACDALNMSSTSLTRDEQLAVELQAAVGQTIKSVPVSAIQKPKAKPVSAAGAHLTQADKLMMLFERLDADDSGLIDTDELVTGLWALPGIAQLKFSNGEKIRHDHIRLLGKRMSKSGEISILSLMNALSIEESVADDDISSCLAEQILTVLYRHRQAVRAGMRCFDKSVTGRVTKDQFQRVLNALRQALEEKGKSFQEAQVKDLCDAISTREKNVEVVAYEEFFNSFELIDAEENADRG